jgi:hypothetical protein
MRVMHGLVSAGPSLFSLCLGCVCEALDTRPSDSESTARMWTINSAIMVRSDVKYRSSNNGPESGDRKKKDMGGTIIS